MWVPCSNFFGEDSWLSRFLVSRCVDCSGGVVFLLVRVDVLSLNLHLRVHFILGEFCFLSDVLSGLF